MRRLFVLSIAFPIIMALHVSAQPSSSPVTERRIEPTTDLRIRNLYGKVVVESQSDVAQGKLEASSSDGVEDSEIRVTSKSSRTQVEIRSSKPGKRIDLKIILPERLSVNIETAEGEIKFIGLFSSVIAKSTTGSITTDMPMGGSSYRFTWGSSRPRIVSENPVGLGRELTGGRHEISGRFSSRSEQRGDAETMSGPSKVDFYTERGVMLINVALSDAPSEIGERPLSESAKRIILTGDSVLTDAIRRAAPKGFAEFSSGLTGNRTAPSFARSSPQERVRKGSLIVQVVDSENRAVRGLSRDDFDIFIGDERVEIESVISQSEPFDVVLLLDVSGSVDDYLDFVRGAAGSFLQTVSDRDRVAIYSFNEELNRLSDFSKDKSALASVLFDLEAGGGTALYDSIALVLTDGMPSSRSERTAIIILSDGDDNKSFVNLKSLNSVIEESSTLIYPLYVPTWLALASRRDSADSALDPSRERYMTLTSKAQAEGERLARLSGGVYYPIKKVEEIQKAYDDIVTRLRSSYTVTYKPVLNRDAGMPSGRTRVEVKRKDVTVTFRGASAVLSR